jgi:hypothetical protein
MIEQTKTEFDFSAKLEKRMKSIDENAASTIDFREPSILGKDFKSFEAIENLPEKPPEDENPILV